MEISRRDFLRFSVAAGSGTALSGLIGSGVNLATRRRAGAGAPDQRRQGHAERLSLLLRRLRDARSHHRRRDRQHRRRSAQPAQRRNPLPEGRGDLPAAHQSQSAHAGSAPGARRDRLGSVGLESGHGPRRGAGEEDPRRDVHREASERQGGQLHDRDLLARRRHARHRVQSHPAEAHARARHRRHREPGANMT